MHTRTTAGQATIEYVAAIALVAAILVVAGPAVGAPDIGKRVVGKMRLALCVVGGDVCSDKMAKEAGLAPCPMKSDQTGREVSVTAFSIEVGGGRDADGHAALGRDGRRRPDGERLGRRGGRGGLRGRLGARCGSRSGVDGAARDRVPGRARLGVQGPGDGRSVPRARGPQHVQRAASSRPRGIRWRAASSCRPRSVTAVGHSDANDRGGPRRRWRRPAALRLGGRVARDGAVTLYGRASARRAEFTWPMLPTIGTGKRDWIVEYTFDRDGSRASWRSGMGEPSERRQAS